MAHGLAEAGADVHVIAISSDPEHRASTMRPIGEGPVRVWAMPASSSGQGNAARAGLLKQHSRFALHAIEALRVARREYGIQILVIYNQQASLALPLTIAGRALGVRVFQQYAEQQVPEDFHGRARAIHYYNQRSTFLLSPARTDGSIVISHALDTLCRSQGALETIVVPALTSTERIAAAPAPPRTPDSPYVLTYVGLGARRDRLGHIVDIATALLDRGVLVRLQMLGLAGGAQTEARELSTRAGLMAHTAIRGWLTQQELEAAMHESHGFIFLREDDLSGRSAFPTRLPELMLTGRPVICSRVGDIPRYLHDGEDLLFVENNDVDEIADRVAALVRTAGASEALGAACARAAMREFDYRRWGQSLLRFLSHGSRRHLAND